MKKAVTALAIKTYYYKDGNNQKTLVDLMSCHNREWPTLSSRVL
ncbi:MAG: hypothetical protein WA749_14890 [Gelidibacter sp.]